MWNLLQRDTPVLDAEGNVVSTLELTLGNYILAARRARICHAMVLYSKRWNSTAESLDYWITASLRARAQAHEYLLRYRALCQGESNR